MATNINGVFKIRRGTNTALASVVLLDGEIGFATDTKVMKVGDGVTAFSSLSPWIQNVTVTTNTPNSERLYTQTEVSRFFNNLVYEINSTYSATFKNPVTNTTPSGPL